MARVIQNGKTGYWFVDSLTPVGESEKTQVITRTATGGTVDVTIAGETLTGVSIVAATTAAGLQSALLAMDYLDSGDIAVTGSNGGPFTVTGNIADITIDDTNATGGTVVISSTTEAVTSDTYAPSVATHLTSANRITETLRTANGFMFGAEDVDVPDLQSKFPKTIPGLYTKATPSLEVYLNDDAGSKDSTVAARFVEEATGYIVRSIATQTPGAGDEVQVWPVRVKSATPSGDADATSAAAQTIDVQLTVPEVPDLHAVCVA